MKTKAAYRPSLEDIEDNSVSNAGYRPSIEDIQEDNHDVNSPDLPLGFNISTGLMSLLSKNPEVSHMIRDLPFAAMGRKPSETENIEQGFGRTLPAMVSPQAKFGAVGRGISSIPGVGNFFEGALGRILPQAAAGAAVGETPLEGAKEYGGLQAVLEALGTPFRIAGKLAEWANPIKYAGEKAEEIRNLAQKGLQEGEKHYKPVHEKYDDAWITPTPNEYLGFHPEDTQYFKPDVNKAYRDFKAEPNFANLHALQSKTGKYPELKPMRESIKQKIISFLWHDQPMLESYQKGSDILKEHYYPYVSNDVLSDIVEHEKPIKSFNPIVLSKALEKSPLVDKASKSLTPINHPLIWLANSVKNRVNIGQAIQFGIPMGIGAIGGEALMPGGSVTGLGAGAMMAKYLEPSMIKFAQNPAVSNALKSIQKILETGGREVLGYNVNR